MTTNQKTSTACLPSRRAMIGALAAVPVASVPVLAAANIEPDDPVFTMIAAAKHAMEKVMEADWTFEVLEADKTELSAEDYDAKWNPEYAVMKAEPQTATGAVALLIFAAENLADQWLFDHDKIVPVLVNAARAIADAPITLSMGLEAVLSSKRMCGEA